MNVTRFKCPKCGRIFKGATIPKGGDGTLRILNWHKVQPGKPHYCPGSREEAIWLTLDDR